MTIIASLNDNWNLLKLDVLFAPDEKKSGSKNDVNDESAEPSKSDECETDLNQKGTILNFYCSSA